MVLVITLSTIASVGVADAAGSPLFEKGRCGAIDQVMGLAGGGEGAVHDRLSEFFFNLFHFVFGCLPP